MTRGLLTAGALVLATICVGGCSTSIADLPGGGAADAATPPKDTGAYLPVHDIPPQRDEAAMKPAEQAKIEAELIAARERQASTAAHSAGK